MPRLPARHLARSVWSLCIVAAIALHSGGCRSAIHRTWTGTVPATDGAVLFSGFVAETPPHPESHASTLVETGEGIMAAWFGGTHEKHPDVCIWTARFDGQHWGLPTQVADGIQPDGVTRHPCWNPVLYQPRHGPLLLFYKVGPSPSRWWGMMMTSQDQGHTWSKPRRLPDGQMGPVRNKPVTLADGSLLCPSSSEEDGWRVQMERTADNGVTWERTGPLNTKEAFGAIQPTILQWPDGRTQILNRSRQKVITECWMKDGDWHQWTPMERTSLPNPNSGIDATVLHDGRGLLVFNPTPSGRTPISVALSRNGKDWKTVLTLEDITDGELSYPAVIQTRDHLVHISYTWKRKKVRHVILDPTKLE